MLKKYFKEHKTGLIIFVIVVVVIGCKTKNAITEEPVEAPKPLTHLEMLNLRGEVKSVEETSYMIDSVNQSLETENIGRPKGWVYPSRRDIHFFRFENNSPEFIWNFNREGNLVRGKYNYTEDYYVNLFEYTDATRTEEYSYENGDTIHRSDFARIVEIEQWNAQIRPVVHSEYHIRPGIKSRKNEISASSDTVFLAQMKYYYKDGLLEKIDINIWEEWQKFFSFDYNENGIMCGEKRYSIHDSRRTRAIGFEVNKWNDITLLKYFNSKGYVYATYHFEYIYDDHHNWIEQVRLSEGNAEVITKRVIDYY